VRARAGTPPPGHGRRGDYWHGPDEIDRRSAYAEEFLPRAAELQANGDDTDRRIRALYAEYCADVGADPDGMRYASGWRPGTVNEATKNSATLSPHLTADAGDVECDRNGGFAWWCWKNTSRLEAHGLYMEHPSATVIRARLEKRQPWCHLQRVPPKSHKRVYWPDGRSPEEWAKYGGTEEA